MTRKDSILIVIILSLGIFIGVMFRGCGKVNPQVNVIPENVIADHKIDSLEKLLVNTKPSHDSLVVSTKTVYRYIQVYHNQHDTLTKLQVDTLVTDCGKLALQSLRNDSIHSANESLLKAVIVIQRSEIDTCNSDWQKLEKQIVKDDVKIKRNRKIAWISSGIAVAEGAVIYLLTKK